LFFAHLIPEAGFTEFLLINVLVVLVLVLIIRIRIFVDVVQIIMILDIIVIPSLAIPFVLPLNRDTIIISRLVVFAAAAYLAL